VPPISTVEGSTRRAERPTSSANAAASFVTGSASEMRWTAANAHGKRSASTPMPASTKP
jgi:hypothetical protein